MSQADTSKRNFGLDAVRATAISLVLVSHFYRPTEVLGVYGVELFFVLSGFLIGGILLRSIARASEGFGLREIFQFWIRRWFRTLPNYYLYLLLYFLLTPPARGVDAKPYLVFLQNFAWVTPDFAGHTWSLTIEEWFYFLFPLTIWLVSLSKHSGRSAAARSFLIATSFFVVVPTILRFTEQLWTSPQNARMIVVCRLDAIMCGVFLAYLYRERKRWGFLLRLWPLGLVGVAISVPMVIRGNYIVEALAFSLIPLSLALILPRCDSMQPIGGLVGASVERISLWSYSLYLAHMLVYGEVIRLTGYEHMGNLSKFAFKILSLTLTFVVSAITYYFFERPCTNLRERWSRPVPSKVLS